ncbi:MAG TPA: DUF983 domain-containing protein [Stellaceae bacterium]|jgi:uncharacterized protein (DUF983 family)|nr:DUF983 domain-containing protein [Stellaceae bacterium]
MAEADRYPPVPVLAAALRCRCPRCGEGKLFEGLLAVAPRCAACGLDLAAQDAGDGPAVFVVLILGALVVGLAILIEIKFAPPFWVHIILWTPVVIGGAIALLRPLKAWLIAMQYRHHLLGDA